jgi:CheY-like chemotaxis protein
MTFPTDPQPAVLLVDDDDDVRAAMTELLQRDGVAVLACASPSEALRVALSSLPIALLVTDLDMPEMRGDELADQVSAVRHGIPIIVVSGTSCPPPRYADDILHKPVDPAELRARVRRALRPSGPPPA